MYVVHLGRLKAPREAAGADGPAHRPFCFSRWRRLDGQTGRGLEEALSASSRDRQGPSDTSKADWSQMARARNPWRHAEPATGVPSVIRGPAALAIYESALCKGFETMIT
jgi:hypothetical protein